MRTPNRTVPSRLCAATAATALAAAATALILALSGCSQPASESSAAGGAGGAGSSATQSVSWPRTVQIPAGAQSPATSLTIKAEPQRIVALDYESAEVLAEIGLAPRLVLVPEAVLNPVLGGHAEELRGVEQTFPVAMEVDAETVISLAPDLVVMSSRHGNEAPIATVLQQAGIATLRLPASWISPEMLVTNIGLIGSATGGEDRAAALASRIEIGLADAASARPAGGSGSSSGSGGGGGAATAGPRVIMLTNQAGRPFVTAGRAYPIELLALSGARDIAAQLGITTTGQIGAEQLVEANPDGIVLIDMNGTGDRMFAELLANPAVASLDAVAKGRVLRIEGRKVQALGLTETIDGLASLTKWVEGLR